MDTRHPAARFAPALLGAAWLTLLGAATLPARPAHAARVVDSDESFLELGGDVKTFFFAVFPYDHLLMPDDPLAQAHLDLRLKFDGGYGRWLRYSFHHQATASLQTGLLDIGAASLTGDGTGMPELVPLSWHEIDTDRFDLRGRMDRMWIAIKVPHLDITLGRQPISFGTGFFFTPTDLVAPFAPTVVDQEYKPGVDALRIDAYFGTSGTLTAVAAYAGDWDLDDLVIAGHGALTVGTYDLGLFVGSVHRDTVLGFDFVGGLGPVGVHGEATLTFRKDHIERKKQPFVRAVLGAMATWPFDLTLNAEVYYQSLGGADPEDYLRLTATDRYQRGELWAMGRWYAALSLSYQLTPLIGTSVAAIANLADPSMMLIPGLSWSVADNASVSVGATIALGARPDEMDPLDFFNPDFTLKSESELLDTIPLNSEFGLMPSMVHVQAKMYF